MGEPRIDLPAVHGEMQRASLPTRAEGAVCPSWPVAASSQDQRTQVLVLLSCVQSGKSFHSKNPAKTVVPI